MRCRECIQFARASLCIEERELTNALVESDTTVTQAVQWRWKWGGGWDAAMRVAGTHPRYARPTIADAAHSMPKRAPHARLRSEPTSATALARMRTQHPLNPRICRPECLAHGIPVIQYRLT